MAVAACKRERIDEPRQALIEDRAVIPTGLVAEGAGNPTLADAGRADDEYLVPFDPFGDDELLEQRHDRVAESSVIQPPDWKWKFCR
jgi:hypothetical protein